MGEAADRATKRYVVTGRVQGVGFRYFVQRNAARIGVGGWVRNRRDGSVEAVASGTEAQLAAFEAALRTGPPLSRVDRLAVSPSPRPDETGFRITS